MGGSRRRQGRPGASEMMGKAILASWKRAVGSGDKLALHLAVESAANIVYEPFADRSRRNLAECDNISSSFRRFPKHASALESGSRAAPGGRDAPEIPHSNTPLPWGCRR